MASAKQTRPVTILIAAMGGEGGGVLTTWIVNAARKQGLPVQATSIPGVAQRTGATTYYIEVVPTPYDKAKGAEPVLDLYPGPGDIDLMVSTELVETGRALEKGFISPERTTLIASTHRVYTLAEKMAMGDGRYDADKILNAAKQMAKDAILFNMERAALDAGTIINAVILGVLAGSGKLPMEPSVFEDGIKEEGKAVESNLRGFQLGLAYARGEVVDMPPKAKEPADTRQIAKSAGDFKRVIEADYPADLHPMLFEAVARVLDYQDAKYARLYLDRLASVREIDAARGDGDFRLTHEAARHLALRMTFEDIIRVAQLKTRGSRFDRVRREVQAQPDQLVKVTEFLKPGAEEFTSVLPPFIGKPVLRWAQKKPGRMRKTHIGMHIRTDTVWGFWRVRALAGMRRFRRMGLRYKEEHAAVEAWLNLLRRSAAKDLALALEVAELARLIKGYGDTHKRGTGNYGRIVETLVEPAIAGAPFDAAAIRKAREAALSDPEGDTLAKTLGELTGERPAANDKAPAAAE